MTITFQEENFTAAYKEAADLLQAHWQELATNKDIRPLNPNIPMYVKLEAIGALKLFTARDDGKLIGYATFLVERNLHYREWTIARADIYYLDPTYRNQGVGLQMFQEIERRLKMSGVQSIVVQDKVTQSNQVLFEGLGFTLIEQTYEKVI